METKNIKKVKGGRKLSAFTLVELIVVITILAILATIGFIGYSNYIMGARDSARVQALKNMSESLTAYSTNKDLPYPEDKVEVKVGTAPNEKTIAYQGKLGDKTIELIQYTGEGVDPKDGSYYSYYTTKSRNHFQLMAFLEDSSNLQNTKKTAFTSPQPSTTNQLQNSRLATSFFTCPTGEGVIGLPKTYAASIDYSDRYPTVWGDKLGILTDEDNTPIEDIESIKTAGELNISTATGTYIARIKDSEEPIKGTGSIYLYNLFLDKNKLKKDSNILIYYYFNSKNKLKDFSVNKNNLDKSEKVEFDDSAIFDKSKNSYLEGNNITLGTDFTIIVKFNVRDNTGWSSDCHNVNILGQHAGGGCTNNEWGLGYSYHSSSSSHNRHILFNYGDGNTWQTIKSNNQYLLKKDLLVIFVKKGNKYFMYVNGKLDKSGDIINMQNNSYKLRIGGTDGQYFDGNIYFSIIMNNYILEEDLVKVLSNSNKIWEIK